MQRVPRRRALLVCMLHQTQVQTRDQLLEMFIRRMRRTRTLAREKLKELQDKHRELEEHMLAVFADVIDETILNPDDNAALGQGVRDILKNEGGAEALRQHYEQVSAYHNNNYRPLMWAFYSPCRAAIFRLSRRLSFHSATQEVSLMDALDYIQSYQHTRRDYLPAIISLDFASARWQALVQFVQCMTELLQCTPPSSSTARFAAEACPPPHAHSLSRMPNQGLSSRLGMPLAASAAPPCRSGERGCDAASGAALAVTCRTADAMTRTPLCRRPRRQPTNSRDAASMPHSPPAG